MFTCLTQMPLGLLSFAFGLELVVVGSIADDFLDFSSDYPGLVECLIAYAHTVHALSPVVADAGSARGPGASAAVLVRQGQVSHEVEFLFGAQPLGVHAT